MVLKLLLNILKLFKSRVYYSDTTDRLHFCVSSLLYSSFAIFVAVKQYFGRPFTCWTQPSNAETSDAGDVVSFGSLSLVQYTEDYCKTQNYFLVGTNSTGNMRWEYAYFHWVPACLAMQGVCFLIPNLIWRALCTRSGINIETVLKTVGLCATMMIDNRRKELFYLARYMRSTLSGRHRGRLTCIYVSVKMLCLANLAFQFLTIQAFLSIDSWYWGFQILRDWHDSIEKGKDTQLDSFMHRFPQSIQCNFRPRNGIQSDKLVECTVNTSYANARIYLFLYFWLWMLSLPTLINLLHWTIVTTSSCSRVSSIQHCLHVAHPGIERAAIARFVDQNLGADGVLVLRFVSSQTTEMISAELLSNLWTEHYMTIARNNSDAEDNLLLREETRL